MRRDMGVIARRVVLVGLLAMAWGCAKQQPSDSAKGGAATSSAPLLPSAPAAPQSNAPSPLPAPDSATRKSCAVLCERSVALKCKNPEGCLPNCLAMGSATPCNEPMSALFSCLVKADISRFECDDETGFAQIREGYCEQEQASATRCLEAKLR